MIGINKTGTVIVMKEKISFKKFKFSDGSYFDLRLAVCEWAIKELQQAILIYKNEMNLRKEKKYEKIFPF